MAISTRKIYCNIIIVNIFNCMIIMIPTTKYGSTYYKTLQWEFILTTMVIFFSARLKKNVQ